MISNKQNGVMRLITAISVVTVLLQTPQLLKLSFINYILWPIVVVFLIIKCDFKLSTTSFGKTFAGLYFLVLLFCILCGLFQEQYLRSNYLKIILLPVCMYWVGSQLMTWSDENQIDHYFNWYIAAAIVLAVTLQIKYVPSFAMWKMTTQYLYDDKNSAAQILASAILICIDKIKKSKSKKVEAVLISMAIYLFFVICLLQCRTAMLALACALVIRGFMYAKNKLRVICAMGLVGVMLYCIPAVNSFIKQALLLNVYKGADINTFSSGRLSNYQRTIETIWQNPIIGCGKWYVDEFYISIIAELGILIGGLVILTWFWRVHLSFKRLKNCGYYALIVSLTIYYLITSVLEAYPPFGPGSCAFLFWIFCGYLDSKSTTEIKGEYLDEIN